MAQQTDTTELSIVHEVSRPTCTAFYAGRPWYAGTKSRVLGSWVFFGCIADTNEKYEQCYQQGDPTAEYSNALVASDGGYIPIPEAAGICRMIPLGDSLLIFAQNGIWQILGGAADGFKADSYQVKNISSFGLIAPRSVVLFENTLAFWSAAGIYILSKNQVTGEYAPISMIEGKIVQLYSDIQNYGNISKVSGFYDPLDKVIHWLYYYDESSSAFNTTNRFAVNRMLCFNVKLQSFYTKSIPFLSGGRGPALVGGFLAANLGNVSSTDTVVDVNTASAKTVVVGSASVVVSTDHASSAPKIPKFLVLVAEDLANPTICNYAVTFADFLNTLDAPDKFMDWYAVDSIGVETPTMPYIITGYKIADDGARILQAPSLITFMIRTETGVDADSNAINGSSCNMQTRWEWTDDASANRWATAQEVYRHRQLWIPETPSATYNDGYPLVIAKSKIRGKGKSLSVKLYASTGLDMQIAGWSMMLAKNTNV